jgi:hypothetical protein
VGRILNGVPLITPTMETTACPHAQYPEEQNTTEQKHNTYTSNQKETKHLEAEGTYTLRL